jgi:hypothetical protein
MRLCSVWATTIILRHSFVVDYSPFMTAPLSISPLAVLPVVTSVMTGELDCPQLQTSRSTITVLSARLTDMHRYGCHRLIRHSSASKIRCSMISLLSGPPLVRKDAALNSSSITTNRPLSIIGDDIGIRINIEKRSSRVCPIRSPQPSPCIPTRVYCIISAAFSI